MKRIMKKVLGFFSKERRREKTRQKEVLKLRQQLIRERDNIVIEKDRLLTMIGTCNIEIQREGKQKKLAVEKKAEYLQRMVVIEERLRFIKNVLEKGLK